MDWPVYTVLRRHARAAGAPIPARPAHVGFDAFEVKCPNEQAAEDLFIRIAQHASAVRDKLGLNDRHARKFGQRGDGLVLNREARAHYQPAPVSDTGLHRTVIGTLAAVFAAFAFSR